MARLIAWYHQHRIFGLMVMLGVASVTAVMMVSGSREEEPILATWTPVLTVTPMTAPPVVIATSPVPPPPQVTATVPMAVSQSSQITHIVQAGETLTRIALIYGLNVQAMIDSNPGITPDRLMVGQLLNVPIAVSAESITATLPPTQIASATPFPTIPPTEIASLTPFPTLPPTEIASATPFPTVPPTQITSLTPVATMPPVQIATVTPTLIPSPTPVPPPLPAMINDLPVNLLVSMNDETVAHITEVYQLGQSLGRNAHAFSKLGDSTIESPYFLDRFDSGPYNLGDYAALQPMIDYYAVSGSFSRTSFAVRRGLGSWAVMDPMWAYNPSCEGGESMLACEIRVHNPSLLFIRLGSNDVGVPDGFDRNLREIVEYTLAQGVIPLLGTKADRHDGASNINNQIIRQISVDYHVPLWDYDLAAQTLPNRGLGGDAVHLTTFFSHDYTDPTAFQRGYGVHNLLALLMLDRVWHVVEGDA